MFPLLNNIVIFFRQAEKKPQPLPSGKELDLTETLDEVTTETTTSEDHPPPPRELATRGSKDTRKDRETRKRLRNTGSEYTTSKNRVISERKSIPLTLCRMKCRERLTEEQRLIIFKEYWNLGSRDKRAYFIASAIEINPKKSQKTDLVKKNREVSCKYYFYVQNNRIQVCKLCFINTLGEKKGFTELIIKKKRNSPVGVVLCDQRGLDPPKIKLQPDQIEQVKNHINQFPAYESHYCRQTTSKKYLNPDLSISKMYSLYKEQNIPNPVSLTVYLRIFHSLNLSFKQPKTDTCHKCDVFKMKILGTENVDEKNLLIAERDAHHNAAGKAYEMKRLDKSLSIQDPQKMVFAFDLQQCLPTPYLNTSVSFYKRQLWSFNLTAHNLSNDEAMCFLWDETISGRGSNQIASCIFNLLQSIPSNVSEITFYSDTCGGQNKNNNVALMFLYAIQFLSSFKIINHKFLVSGHTHMECDSDHALIEKHKKRTTQKINHLNDWVQLIRACKNKKPFTVIPMNLEHFFDFAALSKNKGPFILKKTDTNGEKFYWRNVQWLQYRRESPYEIFFKNTLNEDDEFKTLSFRRRGNNSKTLPELKIISETTLPISAAKKKDLLDLLPLIDRVFHDFYKNLKITNDDPFDADLVETDPDADNV